jgi:hypothetical protein
MRQGLERRDITMSTRVDKIEIQITTEIAGRGCSLMVTGRTVAKETQALSVEKRMKT